MVSIPGSDQQQAVRALAFDRLGLYLLAAGDSKICCVWDCQTWNIVLRSCAFFSFHKSHSMPIVGHLCKLSRVGLTDGAHPGFTSPMDCWTKLYNHCLITDMETVSTCPVHDIICDAG